MSVVIVSGGFDPLHSGHIKLLNHARQLGNRLIVALNSDSWLERKKGQAFMSWDERMTVLSNLHMVDDVIFFDDSDNTAIDAIQQIKTMYPDQQIIFANGGDRTQDNIPEMTVSGVDFAFGVGGEDKANSSSWILQDWRSARTPRPWGYYRVLHELPGVKVKELVVEPGQTLSMQRHRQRSEYWFVAQGSCNLETETGHVSMPAQDDAIKIPVGSWHRLYNPTDQPCYIIEIQYGEYCNETDIERR